MRLRDEFVREDEPFALIVFCNGNELCHNGIFPHRRARQGLAYCQDGETGYPECKKDLAGHEAVEKLSSPARRAGVIPGTARQSLLSSHSNARAFTAY